MSKTSFMIFQTGLSIPDSMKTSDLTGFQSLQQLLHRKSREIEAVL